MKKLSEGRGNLLRQVEMLKQLGIRTSKSLPRNLLDASAGEESELALGGWGRERGFCVLSIKARFRKMRHATPESVSR